MLNELNGFQGREYEFSSLNAPDPSSKSVFVHISSRGAIGINRAGAKDAHQQRGSGPYLKTPTVSRISKEYLRLDNGLRHFVVGH